jgi:hypothetical protein
MEVINVIAAAVVAYAFGAVWYMTLAKPWMAAAGITEEQVKDGSKTPYIISFVMLLVVAGMMRHIFALGGIDTIGKGFMSGLGLGLFIVAPWIVTNYAYSMRPRQLTLIDCGFAVGGCTVIGIVLTLF